MFFDRHQRFVSSMVSKIIPWHILFDNDIPTKNTLNLVNPSVPKQQQKFVEAINNICDIPLSQLPKQCVKGNGFAIFIP